PAVANLYDLASDQNIYSGETMRGTAPIQRLPITEALRASIVEDLPEINDIKDSELRAKVIEGWAVSLAGSSFKRISDMPGEGNHIGLATECYIVRHADHSWWHVAGTLGLLNPDTLIGVGPMMRPRDLETIKPAKVA